MTTTKQGKVMEIDKVRVNQLIIDLHLILDLLNELFEITTLTNTYHC